MQVGGGGSLRSEINVTPLVDVILVLLIIFMVITPVVQMGYLVKVPPKAPPTNLGPDPNQIIIRLAPNGRVFINRDEMSVQAFPVRINSILKGNTGRMVFFAGDPEVNYEDTMAFLDSARAAGAHNIGIIAEDLPAPN
ncbi:MAG TPA: biopolymer transporter ExbD [Thermoanaerobaculia bacterium]|nr:biopolymer transporter ExbD [Thermoanaerobaculia bacterium]